MKHPAIYKPKHDWKNIFDSKYYIAALCILGVIGFSAAATMIYQYIHGIPAAPATIPTGTGILGITQNYGFNFYPSDTERIIVSTFERDALSGTIYCTGPNGEQYEKDEEYQVPNGPCLTATCTCGQQQCTNNEYTCCEADNGGACQFDQTDCLFQGYICTCKTGGVYESCCPANDPCQCGTYCTDINGDKICEGGTYEIAGDVCGTYECECGSGDPCTRNTPTCCLDKDDGTCAIGASGCKTVIDGEVNECICNADGSFSDCIGPPPETCPDSYGGQCDMNEPGCKRVIDGNEYECTCSYNAENSQFLFNDCSSAAEPQGEVTPDTCPDKDGTPCEMNQPGCRRDINGIEYLCTCGKDGNTYTYTQCTRADGCNCVDRQGNRKCPGDEWSFPYGPPYECYECTCTCGGSSSCPCTYSTTLCPS